VSAKNESIERAPGLPCVHCGLCLDTCPTYRVLGNEADSPRGRIYLMEAVRAGSLELDKQTAQHLDGCLGCLACETACPSGVSYGERIEEFRPKLSKAGALPVKDRIWRRIVRTTSRSPKFMTAALRATEKLEAAGLGSLRKRIPGLDVLPVGVDRSSHEVDPVERSRVDSPAAPVRRVALLTGCVADALRPDITRAAVEVLHYNGVEVIPVPKQTCCGALALHTGEPERARESARANVKAFSSVDVDFIVSTASGCGLIMREYETLLAGDPVAAQAAQLAAKVRDVTEVLVEVGVAAPQTQLPYGRVLYHDACHLLHGARVTDAPRKVLETALGRMADDLGENHLCCGSAGTYNIEHPRMAKTLGDRKAELAADAEIVAVGNVGCMLQIKAALERRGSTARTAHPLELLAEAYATDDD
jgi:glycolate oxidase iron-sulfur subunit